MKKILIILAILITAINANTQSFFVGDTVKYNNTTKGYWNPTYTGIITSKADKRDYYKIRLISTPNNTSGWIMLMKCDSIYLK